MVLLFHFVTNLRICFTQFTNAIIKSTTDAIGNQNGNGEYSLVILDVSVTNEKINKTDTRYTRIAIPVL